MIGQRSDKQTNRGTRRRRHRGPGRERLVERGPELAALKQNLAAARANAGGAVFIEAHAGMGKSRLLTAAGDMARDAGMRILAATASTLERDFPFGLAIQLFEPLWLTSTPRERKSLLTGPARLASRLLTEPRAANAPELDGQEYPVIHGLLCVLQELVSVRRNESGPGGLVMLVDDLHLADCWSLRFLAYLTERIVELPISLILAVRPGESCADPMALVMLRRAAREPLLRPGSLSAPGIARLVRREFPNVDDGLVAACSAATGGSPFLLVELLAKLHKDVSSCGAMTAKALPVCAPNRVSNRVIERLAAMSEDEREVAKAVALFAEGTSIRQVSRLAELGSHEVLRAADALAGINLLAPGIPLSFKYPLERKAVAESLSALERGQGHRRAAAGLLEDRAPAAEIAAHLIEAPPAENPEAVAALREAATQALESGATQRAIQLLERALAEGPTPGSQVDLLVELGQAEAKAGLPRASEHLRAAREISDRPRRRTELSLVEAHLLYGQGRYGDAAKVLGTGLDELDRGDQDLAPELTARYVSAASLAGAPQAKARQMRDQMIDDLQGEPTPLQRSAIAHTAAQESLLGAPRDAVTRLADLAWGDGMQVEIEPSEVLGWPLLGSSLVFVDELERAVEICDAVLAALSPARPSAQRTLASCCRAWALYEQGHIAKAESQAGAALKVLAEGSRSYEWTALAVIACCQIERGDLVHAELTLATIKCHAIHEISIYPRLLEIRAQLRLAQHRPREALKDAVRAGVILETEFPRTTPGAIPWRSTAALANLALGEPERARILVAEELQTARRIGATRIVIRDLRILGLALGGTEGLDRLAEAVRTGETYPSRVEHVRALVDFGAALRRGNRRADAREPLRKGLDLSSRRGSSVLADRAQTELIATGARPRRRAASGLESLTVSQRRVTDLAVTGLTTRQMAEVLFITPKTVEYHLRQTYRKLDVASREELGAAVGSGLSEAA